jgi:hypothetical protein
MEFLKACEVDVLKFSSYEDSCVMKGLRQSNLQLFRFYKKGANTGPISVCNAGV